MRRFLIETLNEQVECCEFWLIAGATGSGKTRLLQQLPRAVDLEGLAKHRGSAFGSLLEPQPAQIDFENQLALELLRLAPQAGPVLLEDEGRLIGRLYIPDVLRQRMEQAPLLVLDYPVEDRVQVVLEDYIIDLGERYRRARGEHGFAAHWEKLRSDLFRTRKRLGLERHEQISRQLDLAFQQQQAGDGIEGHRLWIRRLLEEYYDPMYRYQLERRAGRKFAQGTREHLADVVSQHLGRIG